MNIYVGNLAYSLQDDELQEIFAEYGAVVSAKIIIDKMTNKSKGFGFVEMSNDDEARNAIEHLNQAELEGRTLIVNEARERTERPVGQREFRPRDNNRSYGGGGGGGGYSGGGGGGGGGYNRDNNRNSGNSGSGSFNRNRDGR